MKTNATFLLGVSLFALLVGCDVVDRRAIDRERSDSLYRSAMADYAAGRLDKAVSGLERVVAATPGNSSARFQLACLLQDSKKDYLGAICQYREFLLADKSGDKAGLAKERLAQCERLLGPELVKKFDIGDNASLTTRNAELQARIVALEKTNADLEKRLEKALARAGESADQVERMRKLIQGESMEGVARPAPQDLERSLLDDEDDGKTDRIKFSKDVKNLVLDAEREEVTTPFASEPKPAAPVAKTEEKSEGPKRPSEYVVQDGDTLYKLAVRFYGARSAWVRIREANKAIISTDGRIKTGQKLVLP